MPTSNQRPHPNGRVVSVRLDDETIARLDELAERTSRSRSVYIKHAIEVALPQLERDYNQQVIEFVEASRESHQAQGQDHLPELPIPRADVVATLSAYEPGTTHEDVDQYLTQMQEMFTRLVIHDGLSLQAAEDSVRGMYLEELNAAVAERDSRDSVREATEEEVANITMEDALDGAGCDSYEEFEERYGQWL